MALVFDIMIKSFGDRETELIWNGRFSKRLPNDIQQVGRRKLRMINNAQILEDLKIPPGNRLELLKGDLAGLYSIRINGQWRVVFDWRKENAENVRIEDYH